MDERRNLPSASGFERIKLCRGSRELESKFTQVEFSAIAESGSLIHSALAGETDPKLLNEQEQWTFEHCKSTEQALVLEWCEFDQSRMDSLTVTGEERIFLQVDGEEVLSGQYDKLYIDQERKRALIVDYKTGYIAVTDPASNLQLRVYAVLVWQKYGIDDITVSVIQPHCKPSWATCQYIGNDLELSYKEIVHVLETSHAPNAKRVAGEKQCTYCRAKAVCPELLEFSKKAVATITPSDKKIYLVSSDELKERIANLSNEELSAALDTTKLVEKWSEAVKAEAKMRLNLNVPIPNYGMVSGRNSAAVADNYKVYEILKTELDIPPQEIINTAMGFTIGKLETLINRNGIYKKTQLRGVLKDILGDQLVTKTSENMLKRMDEEGD